VPLNRLHDYNYGCQDFFGSKGADTSKHNGGGRSPITKSTRECVVFDDFEPPTSVFVTTRRYLYFNHPQTEMLTFNLKPVGREFREII
jgi:hypothetical protein